ncbi:MAG: hypothetical protein M5U14_09595 [Acidimicrobiia bacterium]|nr:hypothetical protein [Acidimicrobiia bacterium]
MQTIPIDRAEVDELHAKAVEALAGLEALEPKITDAIGRAHEVVLAVEELAGRAATEAPTGQQDGIAETLRCLCGSDALWAAVERLEALCKGFEANTPVGFDQKITDTAQTLRDAAEEES